MLREYLTQEQLDGVSEIVGRTLRGHFGSAFDFDPIVVKPDMDGYGDPYLRVLVIFDGKQKLVDPQWASGLIGRIKEDLLELGVPPYPSISFIKKSEWKVMGPRFLREGT